MQRGDGERGQRRRLTDLVTKTTKTIRVTMIIMVRPSEQVNAKRRDILPREGRREETNRYHDKGRSKGASLSHSTSLSR